MKSSKALKEARKLIESGEKEFLCTALEQVGGGRTEVKRRIRNSILPYRTVGLWVAVKCHLEDYSRDEMREYRLRWIDWLIPQYEAKGD